MIILATSSVLLINYKVAHVIVFSMNHLTIIVNSVKLVRLLRRIRALSDTFLDLEVMITISTFVK